MILLSADNIEKRYSEKTLLEGVSLTLGEGERVGLIGVNGTGKTTLLRIVAGAEPPDGGKVERFGKVRISYLPQNPDFLPGTTVLEQVEKGISPDITDRAGFEGKAMLTKLGIADFDADVSTLSGGQKKRVALAAALAHSCEILILDEPTNHLDSETVAYLEDYLRNFSGALLLVTHDRYFLDRVTNRILELDRGQIYRYDANYSGFLALKAEREEMAAASERKRVSLLRKELEWASRGARARGTKSRYRLDRIEDLKKPLGPQAEEGLTLQSVSTRLGKKIIEAEEISKSFGGRTLFSGFDLLIHRDARIGIIGENGCGKSTLMKVLGGLLPPDTGKVEMGGTVKIGYFSQESEEMDPNLRVIDYLRNFGDILETPDGRLTAAQLLERFLFPPALHYTQIFRLSGGERRRLFLLSILIGAPNVLLLDEPTNDLDIATLQVLEDYLDSFSGAVIAVSHDRYFLDRTADELLWFENGRISRTLGGYSDWLEIKQSREAEKAAVKKESSQQTRRNHEQKLKFTYKEQKEYETIDADIEALEEQIGATEAEIQANSSDFSALEELLTKKADLEARLEEKTERWMYLTDLAERIETEARQKQ